MPEVKKSDVDNLKNLSVASVTSGASVKSLAFQSKFDEAVEGGCVEVRIWLFFCARLFRSSLLLCYFFPLWRPQENRYVTAW